MPINIVKLLALMVKATEVIKTAHCYSKMQSDDPGILLSVLLQTETLQKIL
jgi:hypothetical protein